MKLCKVLVCLFDGVECHFQQYFSYIVAVSFVGGGNRRKPLNVFVFIYFYLSKCSCCYKNITVLFDQLDIFLPFTSQILLMAVCTRQHYVVKFVSDLRRVSGFLRFPPPTKLTATI
jgi:hypothetical protein